MANQAIIDRVLRYEGGFVNNAFDKGGPTNFGITAATLGAWRRLGRPATVEEVKALTAGEAGQIYEARFISDPGFDGITDDYLRTVVVDCAVLYGPKRAAIWLQQALGVVADGAIGSQTTNALAAANAAVVAHKVLAMRLQRIGEVVTADRTQVIFLSGWINRATDLLASA